MKRTRVLIIDDDSDYCGMVKTAMEKSGDFEVSLAASGQEGIQAVKIKVPDAILLDVVMPTGEGSEILAALRAEPGCENVPVIFLTALLKKNELPSLNGKIGGHAFVSKFSDIEDICACVMESVKNK